jgi:hypothetical protein
MGIGDSEGKVHDFQGSKSIRVGNGTFMTKEIKFVAIDINNFKMDVPEGKTKQQVWDEAIKKSDDYFRTQNHQICCNNCHDHTATALRHMGGNRSCLNTTACGLWLNLILNGQYTRWQYCTSNYCPIITIIVIVVLCVLYA